MYETHHVCSTRFLVLASGAVYTEIRKTPRLAVQLNPLPATLPDEERIRGAWCGGLGTRLAPACVTVSAEEAILGYANSSRRLDQVYNAIINGNLKEAQYCSDRVGKKQ